MTSPYSVAPSGSIRRNADQRAALKGQALGLAQRYAPVTLRQLFYLLVNDGWLAKTEREYKNLGTLITHMRRRGEMSWSYVIDAGRYTRVVPMWESPSAALRSVAAQFRRRVWDYQPVRVYVGTEKEALAGVMQPVCDEYGVPLVVSRGYPSSTYLNELYEELHNHVRAGQSVVFFYYGDHDPSGDGISDLFEYGSVESGDLVPALVCNFIRSALTAEQIIDNDYLTRPPKPGDSRTVNWVDGGAEAADVDTISPDELRNMVRADIESVIDEDLFDETMKQEVKDIERLQTLADEWSEETS